MRPVAVQVSGLGARRSSGSQPRPIVSPAMASEAYGHVPDVPLGASVAWMNQDQGYTPSVD